jgi:pimeloyl-ACP methyl ester carboxylesterase
VILIHGFPEDWYEFRKVMPQLVSRFTVVAVDLRGGGESATTSDASDAANLAKDIHELAEHLHLEHVYVVGHDIGGMVAYAFARRYPWNDDSGCCTSRSRSLEPEAVADLILQYASE